MKRDADNEQLLNDVLGEGAPEGFREAMLGEAIRLAGGRRRLRRMRRAGVAAVTVLMAALVMVLISERSGKQTEVARQTKPREVQKSYVLVHTEALPSSAIITTQPLVRKELLASGKVGIVDTTTGNFRFINDEELLGLLGPRPAVLIRTGPNSEELVFANPEDQKN
jgi:hypothetical protein